jgi:hypothetical protein
MHRGSVPSSDDPPRIGLPRTPVNMLIGQLLQGPAVAVGIPEVGVQNPSEILNLADLDSPLGEFRTRRLYVRDDQV